MEVKLLTSFNFPILYRIVWDDRREEWVEGMGNKKEESDITLLENICRCGTNVTVDFKEIVSGLLINEENDHSVQLLLPELTCDYF